MSVHYKFKNAVDYDTLTFDGVHISVGDLKQAIIQKKNLSRAECDYLITDAESKKVYETDEALIPKNSSVIVARIPLAEKPRRPYFNDRPELNSMNDANRGRVAIEKITSDLSKYTSEEDKISAAIHQSTDTYDSSNYERRPGRYWNQGPLPASYRCFRCGQQGHHIKQCPQNGPELKKSTGIPLSFMVRCDATEKGAYRLPDGGFAKSVVEAEAYEHVKKEKPPSFGTDSESTEETKESIIVPEELLCLICHDVLMDAVLSPCCASSFCVDCIQESLIDSDEHQCPVCHVTDVSPDSLIPCIKLRRDVTRFLNETNPLWQKTLATNQLPSNSSQVIIQNDNENNSQGIKTPVKSPSSPTNKSSPRQDTEIPSPRSQEATVDQQLKDEVPGETASPSKENESDEGNEYKIQSTTEAVPIQNLIQPIHRMMPHHLNLPHASRPQLGYGFPPHAVNMNRPSFPPRLTRPPSQYDYPVRRPLLGGYPGAPSIPYQSSVGYQDNGYYPGHPRHHRPLYREGYNGDNTRYHDRRYDSHHRPYSSVASSLGLGIDASLDYDAAVERFTQHLNQSRRRSYSRSRSRSRSRSTERRIPSRRYSRSPERIRSYDKVRSPERLSRHYDHHVRLEERKPRSPDRKVYSPERKRSLERKLRSPERKLRSPERKVREKSPELRYQSPPSLHDDRVVVDNDKDKDHEKNHESQERTKIKSVVERTDHSSSRKHSSRSPGKESEDSSKKSRSRKEGDKSRSKKDKDRSKRDKSKKKDRDSKKDKSRSKKDRSKGKDRSKDKDRSKEKSEKKSSRDKDKRDSHHRHHSPSKTSSPTYNEKRSHSPETEDQERNKKRRTSDRRDHRHEKIPQECC